MKIDIYNHKQRYLNWKEKTENSDIEGISKENSDLIKKYIFDMERGLNVSIKSPKGSRSYIRLNNLKQRLYFLAREFEEKYSLNSFSKITEEQLFHFFNSMRTGEIRRKDGEIYQSVSDYIKVFKAFWHWNIKVNKKNGNEIIDITNDLDTSFSKPKWVYLDEIQIKKLCDNAKYEYKALIMFLYDSGIRAPTELINIRVSDLYNDCKELNIRDEISKTFGRRIKLIISSELVKDYIKTKGLKLEDQLFPISPQVVNKYLQRLAKRVLGEDLSGAGKKYTALTMYDFRHCSCCYWLPRYKSESALKYRFGWKKSDKIHYYSELLGMKDTISEDDLLIDVTKTEIEKRLIGIEKENTILKEKIEYFDNKMIEIQNLVDILFKQIAV